MVSQTLKDELDQLGSSVSSEAYTPHLREHIGQSQDLSRNTERLLLLDIFSLVEALEIAKEESNLGTLLSNVYDSIVEADNKKYEMRLAEGLSNDLNDICY